jgi:Flp pilus assembly protein TadD
MARNSILWSVLAALALFLALYFGCNRLSTDEKASAISASIQAKNATNTSLVDVEAAKKSLPADQLQAIVQLEEQAKSVEGAEKSALLKKIASKWYQNQRPDMSGQLALDIAALDKTAEAWGIAGTTLTQAARMAKEADNQRRLADEAIASFDKATELAPDNWQYNLNKAICLAEFPLPTEPMKGILLLRELDTQHPDQPAILLTLGRLAIQTGQFERAITRLEKVAQIAPDNKEVYCFLAEAYAGANQTDKAAAARAKCP